MSPNSSNKMHKFTGESGGGEFTFQDNKQLPRGGDSYRPGGSGSGGRRDRGRGRDRDRDRDRDDNRDRDRRAGDRHRDNRPRRNWDRGQPDSRRAGGRSGIPTGPRQGGGVAGGMERKPWAPTPAYRRPMMIFQRQKTPEQLPGMVSGGIIFDNADEDVVGDEEHTDDSGSAMMDVDSASENEGDGGGVPRVGTNDESPKPVLIEDIKEGEEAVKSEKMKVDVIQMIRKAKTKSALTPVTKRNEVAENDDFISFGLSDEEEDRKKNNKIELQPVMADKGVDEDHGRKSQRGNDGRKVDAPPLSAARDKGFSHKEEFQKTKEEMVEMAKVVSPLPQPLPPGVDWGPPGAGRTLVPAFLPPPPGLSTPTTPTPTTSTSLPISSNAPPSHLPAGVTVVGGINFPLPPKPPPPEPKPAPSRLRIRERRDAVERKAEELADDGDHDYDSDIQVHEIISIGSSTSRSRSATPPLRGRKRKYDEALPNLKSPGVSASFALAPEYLIPRGSKANPVPWHVHDHSRTFHMSDLLNKEIHDFLNYIRPRRYEHSLRRHVIHEVRKALTTGVNAFSDADVRVFGSFAAELYLPTSDLDLVLLSREFARTGTPKYSSKQVLYRVSNLLRKARIPKDNKVVVISKAKVPIVKFVDAKTNINVDICFENLSGLTANGTFRAWRKQYPAMPALAVVIKHFLELRKLNEVYQGGLGGFCVMCLIISLFQMHPGFSSGNLPVAQNLGTALMEFLHLYGKCFDTSRVGIDVQSGRYFRKPAMPPPVGTSDTQQARRQYFLLHVTDPNDESNNIAKSSYAILDVFGAFGQGYDALERRMKEVHGMGFKERRSDVYRGGLLGVLLGANYKRMEKQREHMKKVFEEVFGERVDVIGEDEFAWDMEDQGEERKEGWKWSWSDGEEWAREEAEAGQDEDGAGADAEGLGWVMDLGPGSKNVGGAGFGKRTWMAVNTTKVQRQEAAAPAQASRKRERENGKANANTTGKLRKKNSIASLSSIATATTTTTTTTTTSTTTANGGTSISGSGGGGDSSKGSQKKAGNANNKGKKKGKAEKKKGKWKKEGGKGA